MLELAGDADLRRQYASAARQGLTGSFDIRQMVVDLDRTYLSLLREQAGESAVAFRMRAARGAAS